MVQSMWGSQRCLRGVALTCALTMSVAACGGSTGTIAFDSVPPTTLGSTSNAPPGTSATSSDGSGSTAPTATTAGTSPSSVSQNEWAPATQGLVGLSSECGNLSLLSSKPDQDLLIAGISLQGLWSADLTDHWTRLGTGQGSATITNRATKVLYDPANADTFWETGAYNGGGVYRTDDGGQTFRQLGDISHVDDLTIDFADPSRQTMLATLHEQPKIFRSTDGGATWKDLSSALPQGIGYATGPLLIDSKTYLLGTSNTQGSAVFRTSDSGATWTKVFAAGIVGQPLVTQDGTIYFVLDQNQGIIKSTDQGLTWKLVTRQAVVSPASPSIIELPGGRLAAIGNNLLIVSSDQGATWQSLGPPLPISPNGVVYSASRKAFYIWHFDCDFTTPNPIKDNTVMRLDATFPAS